MKDALPYLPLLNLLLAPFLWVLNEMRRDLRELRSTQVAHGEAIAQLQTADAIRHPGQQSPPFAMRANAGD